MDMIVGYMRSLSDADKVKTVVSFNQLCKTPIRMQRVDDDSDAVDDVPRDNDSDEDREASQSRHMEMNPDVAISSKQDLSQENEDNHQLQKSSTYLDSHSRQNRGSKMKFILEMEKTRINASSKPNKDAVVKERVQSIMGVPSKKRNSKFNFHKIDFAKILQYFSTNQVLQADEMQWYTSIGLKPDQSCCFLHLQRRQMQCNSCVSSRLE